MKTVKEIRAEFNTKLSELGITESDFETLLDMQEELRSAGAAEFWDEKERNKTTEEKERDHKRAIHAYEFAMNVNSHPTPTDSL